MGAVIQQEVAVGFEPGFKQFRGNQAVVEAIRGMLAQNRMPHALLFCGPAGVGKYTLAQMVAKAIHCQELDGDFCGRCKNCNTIALADDRWKAVEQAEQEREKLTKRPRELPLLIQHHPDVLLLSPNGPLRLFQIEQARHLKQVLEYLPAGNRGKVYIIPDADRMDAAAANSLLKSLEEPPPHVVLLLTTTNEAALLPTIRSRCVPLWFSPLHRGEVARFLEERGVGKTHEERLARAAIAKGSPGAALRLDLERYFRTRDTLLAILVAGTEGRDYAALFSQSQTLTGREETLENLLDVLYSLFQDILHIETKVNGEPLRNTDRPESLMRLARWLGVREVRKAVASLEEMERNLRRNVPSRLSVEAFAVGLAKARRIS
ncbi:MAG: AAA family ATPase [Acidobacteria bacterium]|nr:AAA family ATPase [Acidobacteriota bacterium]